MKTKEEIFDEQYHIWSGSDNSIRLHMLEAMKIYADQEKQELKEKITSDIKYIRNRTFKQDGMPVGENEDFVRACDEILKIVNAKDLKV